MPVDFYGTRSDRSEVLRSFQLAIARNPASSQRRRFSLPLLEIPHHPSGGALPGEHRADAEGAVDKVNEQLTLTKSIQAKKSG